MAVRCVSESIYSMAMTAMQRRLMLSHDHCRVAAALSESSSFEPLPPLSVGSGSVSCVFVACGLEAVVADEPLVVDLASSVPVGSDSEVLAVGVDEEEDSTLSCSTLPPQEPLRPLRSEEPLMLATSLPQFSYCPIKTVSDSRSNTTK